MHRQWNLKRNCSLTPRQALLAFGSLAALTLVIGAGFTLLGAWPMLGFAGLDVLCLALALRHYTRHALDHEQVTLADGMLSIERSVAGVVRHIELELYWAQVTLPRGRRELIRLESRGAVVEIGRFVSDEVRRQVGAELRLAVRGAGAGPGALVRAP